ncbi:MAG: hypothetical protein V7K48_21070 [Nostoc sp.]
MTSEEYDISLTVADYIGEINDCCGNTADWMEQVSDEQYQT